MGGLVNAIAKATRRLQTSLTVLEEVPTVGEGWGGGKGSPAHALCAFRLAYLLKR